MLSVHKLNASPSNRNNGASHNKCRAQYNDHEGHERERREKHIIEHFQRGKRQREHELSLVICMCFLPSSCASKKKTAAACCCVSSSSSSTRVMHVCSIIGIKEQVCVCDLTLGCGQ